LLTRSFAFYNRISDSVKEQNQVLLEELDDRTGFTTEAKQTEDLLKEIKVETATLTPNMAEPEVMEKIEKLKVRESCIFVLRVLTLCMGI